MNSVLSGPLVFKVWGSCGLYYRGLRSSPLSVPGHSPRPAMDPGTEGSNPLAAGFRSEVPSPRPPKHLAEAWVHFPAPQYPIWQQQQQSPSPRVLPAQALGCLQASLAFSPSSAGSLHLCQHRLRRLPGLQTPPSSTAHTHPRIKTQSMDCSPLTGKETEAQERPRSLWVPSNQGR